MKGITGCWKCRHIEWIDDDSEASPNSGYFCNKRNDEPHVKFKVFPCNRMLKCFVPESREISK